MASSLLELATQIQSMELSFTTILLEAAMKLASLTDANIFMIVDTQEGRRFSGKDYLCNAYLNSQLTPSFGDVQVFVNPSVSAVDLKTLSPDKHHNLQYQQHSPFPSPFDGNNHRNSSPNNASLKASYPLDNRFRKRTLNGSNPGGVRRRDGGGADSNAPAAKIPRSSVSASSSSASQALKVEDVSQPSDEVTAPHQPDEKSQQQQQESKVKSLHEISEDDDEEYSLQIVEDSSQYDAGGSGEHQQLLRQQQQQQQQQQAQHFPELDATSFATPQPFTSAVVRRYSACSSPSNPSSSSSASNWVSSAASLAALEALTSISDVTLGKIVAAKEFPLEQILTKGSAANKLLCSILYDVVKDISKICADLGFVSAKEGSAKDVFYALLEKFVKENFPSLLTTDLMFYEGTNRMSAIAYIRSKTRVMFFMRMKAIQKKYDNGGGPNSSLLT